MACRLLLHWMALVSVSGGLSHVVAERLSFLETEAVCPAARKDYQSRVANLLGYLIPAKGRFEESPAGARFRSPLPWHAVTAIAGYLLNRGLWWESVALLAPPSMRRPY